MTTEIIGQILSIVAMILTVLSFQLKTKKQILILQTAGSALFLISFLLLGSMAAVYLNLVFVARSAVYSLSAEKKWAAHPAWLFVFIAASVIAGALGFRSYWDILPIVGAIFGTVAMSMKNENMLRLFKLGDSPCWLVYNVSVPSVGGVICEAFNIVSLTVGIIRYRHLGFTSGAVDEGVKK